MLLMYGKMITFAGIKYWLLTNPDEKILIEFFFFKKKKSEIFTYKYQISLSLWQI